VLSSLGSISMITKRGYFLLAALVLASAVSTVKAQSTASVYSWQNASVPGSPFNTQAAADAAVKSWIVTQVSSCGAPFSVVNTWNGGLVNSKLTLGTACGTQQAGTLQNANGSNTTFALGYVTGKLPCPAAGTTGIRNFTMGFSSNPNAGTEAITYPSPTGTMTLAGGGATCAAAVGLVKACWVSDTPNAQGLYRASCDYGVTFTGASATPTDTETKTTDTAASPATCSGAFGTVNGKAVCIPSSKEPTVPLPTPTASIGNPPAGSDGTQPIGSRTPATGTNNDNAGSPVNTSTGTSVTSGSGLPSAAGTTAGNASSSSGLQKADLQDIKADCDKKPNSIGCSEFGSATNETLGTTNSGFNSIGSVNLASSSGCPAPESFSVAGHQYAVSFTPVCNGANDYIKPVMIVLGAALAAFIFIGGFKA